MRLSASLLLLPGLFLAALALPTRALLIPCFSDGTPCTPADVIKCCRTCTAAGVCGARAEPEADCNYRRLLSSACATFYTHFPCPFSSYPLRSALDERAAFLRRLSPSVLFRAPSGTCQTLPAVFAHAFGLKFLSFLAWLETQTG